MRTLEVRRLQHMKCIKARHIWLKEQAEYQILPVRHRTCMEMGFIPHMYFAVVHGHFEMIQYLTEVRAASFDQDCAHWGDRLQLRPSRVVSY